MAFIIYTNIRLKKLADSLYYYQFIIIKLAVMNMVSYSSTRFFILFQYPFTFISKK